MATARLWRGLPLAVGAAGAIVVTNVVVLLGHGFDFTDGGNSWNLLADPAASPLNVSQAGHVYQAPFALLGRHDVWFQRLDALATAVLAATLGWALLRTVRLSARPTVEVALAVAAGAAAFAMLFQWQAPPNYKWLTVQGLLIGAAALVPRPGDRGREVLLGVALGVGGWLAFLGKPPAGLAVGVLALLHVLVSRTSWWRPLVAGTVAAVLLLASAVAIDGSVPRFVADLSAGAEESAVLAPGHGIDRLLALDVPSWTWTTTLLLLGTAFAVALLGVVAARATGTLLGLAAVVVAVVTVAAAVVASTTWSWWPGFEWGRGGWALGVPLGTAVAVAVVAGGRGRGAAASPPGGTPIGRLDRRRYLADAALLLLLAQAYALGSANNTWHEASRAAVFWLLAALPLVGLVVGAVRDRDGGAVARTRLATTTLAGVVLVTAGLVHVGAREPYHQQQPLRTMQTPPTVTTPHEGVRLSADAATYVDTLVAGARAAGLSPGTPIIDVSGHSPGEVYLLQGRSPGRSWLIGGWPGSEQVAIDALGRAGCDVVARAWLLDHPGTTVGHVPAIPDRFGFDVAADYRVAVRATAPDGTPRRLLAPTRPVTEARAACEAATASATPDAPPDAPPDADPDTP